MFWIKMAIIMSLKFNSYKETVVVAIIIIFIDIILLSVYHPLRVICKGGCLFLCQWCAHYCHNTSGTEVATYIKSYIRDDN
jgi:hypothetical protein